MEASKQEVFFIAIRMQTGSIRRELPLIGLGERATAVVLEVLDRVEGQVREWSIEGMVTPGQLQEVLAGLMRVTSDLREVKEAGKEDGLTLEMFEALGVLPPRPRGGGEGPVN